MRACFAAKAGLAEAREVARVASPRKFQPRETFGQTLRRHTPTKPTCWACESTDVDYFVLGGKQLLCCPDHPKVSHPKYEPPPPSAVPFREGNRTIPVPAPRSTVQKDGRRKFREGCEPGKYEGLEHSEDTTRCQRCAGSGMFVTGMMNGKPTGPGGPCFRCSGKGHQSCCDTATHLARYEAIMNNECDDISACCDVVRNDLFDRFRTVSAY